MKNIKYSSDEFQKLSLPLRQELENGVLAVWKSRKQKFLFDRNWNHLTLLDDKNSLEIIDNLIRYDSVYESYQNNSPVDFVIIDKNGNVLLRNFNVEVFCDENGFVHINSSQTNQPTYFVKSFPHKTHKEFNFFFGGESFDSLNRAVRYAIASDFIKKPKDYDSKNHTLKYKPTSSQKEKI